jgi:molecular chaperone GrpE
MAETHHDRTNVPPREGGHADGRSRQEGEGDAQIRQSPPNVERAEPPASEITGDGDDAGEEDDVDDYDWADDTDANAEVERLQREVATLNDRILRIAAEFDNYRRRVDRERAELPQRARAEVVRPLLDVIDDLARVGAYDDSTPSAALLEGVRLVNRKFVRVLEMWGVVPVDPAGEPFDPESMEAVATTPAASAAEDNTVADVFQKGYRLGETLIRPARVRVKQHDG